MIFIVPKPVQKNQAERGLFGHPKAERTAGSVKYRKVFCKVANAANLALTTARIFVETPTPGDDTVVLISGTHTDTQAEADDYTRFYGAGTLDANVSAGAGTFAVNVESGNAYAGANLFQNGDLVRISDKTSVDASGGTVEFVRLASSNAVSWNGNKATLTLASGVTLANAYVAATPTRIASVIEVASVVGTLASWAETSSAGTYNEATYPVTLDSIGGIEQTWTVTFSSGTAFGCSGNTVGSVGTGTKGTTFAPNNATFSTPYFTLLGAGWGGTWANGESLTFITHPAAHAVWQRRTVPAGASALSGDSVIVAISGETA